MLRADGATFHLVVDGPFWVGGRHKEIVEHNADRVATIGVLSRPRLFAWYRAAGEWALTNFPEQRHVETLIRLDRA
jgi:hypothetical protein